MSNQCVFGSYVQILLLLLDERIWERVANIWIIREEEVLGVVERRNWDKDLGLGSWITKNLEVELAKDVVEDNNSRFTMIKVVVLSVGWILHLNFR